MEVFIGAERYAG